MIPSDHAPVAVCGGLQTVPKLVSCETRRESTVVKRAARLKYSCGRVEKVGRVSI